MSQLEDWVYCEGNHYQQTKLTKVQEAYGGAAFLKLDDLRWPVNEWPIEAGRYTLIWLPACPRAQRTALSLKLLGLEDVIGTIELAPHRGEAGWEFGEDGPFPGARSVKDLYDDDSQPSQPLLWDRVTNRIVTDDQYNLSTYFVKDWQAFHRLDALDFYPAAKREAIDAMNGFIYQHVNRQIYRAGYAATPEKHQVEAAKLTQTWQVLDAHLQENSFLLGEQLTDADLRLFPNLLRFEIYYKQFGLDQHHLDEFPQLWRYAQALYRMPAFQETSKLDLITETHYRSPHNLKKFGDRYAQESAEEAFRLWH